MVWQSLVGAVVLAVVHLFASKLQFLDVIPRSRWLSIAGGVSVAYALVHLLPELQAYHGALAQSSVGEAFAQEHLIWVVTLLGLIVFYGLERAAIRSRDAVPGDGISHSVFWVHLGSYAVYNTLIGYLLVQEDRDWQSLVLFLIGIGLHFVVNDHGLQQHYRKSYRRWGRWLLSAAILLGWLIGISLEIHEAVTASVAALLAGGILLNTFKEELPREQESRFWAFAFGALGYAALLLTL